MEDSCNVGLFIQENCHTSEGKAKELISINKLSSEEQTLLKLRLCKDDLKTVCKYHKKKYLTDYNHIFGTVCCDPLNYHSKQKKKCKKGCIEIKLHHLKKEKNLQINLIPGKSLCSTCYKKIFSVKHKDESLNDNLYIPPAQNLNQLDSVCSVLEMSPVSKLKRVNSKKRSTALQNKTRRISDRLKKKLHSSFPESTMVNEETTNEISTSLCKEYSDLIEKLKGKLKQATSREEKVRIISLMPESWSRSKIANELQVSEYLVRITKELVEQQGVLPSLVKKKSGKQLETSIITFIEEFYQQDDISRMLPGKKDCVSVKINGVKVNKQKRLILCNLRELYVHFKNTYPDMKIGLSKFCSLRPKWCVLAGSPGTHMVCVCTYHQNVKLMLECGCLTYKYKDLLQLMTCDMERYECMMGICSDCKDVEKISEMLTKEMEEMTEEVKYKQWVSVDRSNLIDVVQSAEDFIDTLIDKLVPLKKHHFLSKIQSAYLREKKEALNINECIVLADFSENFSFVVQDEAQGFHWTTMQATVHPFVLYFKKDNMLKTQCLCVISDYLLHNTVAVHTFQKHVVDIIKEIIPKVNSLIYFSDGASSQYKNRKNFANLCNHKSDFNMDCEWNFFATAHGKNSCDGVGGTTKREATKVSLQRPYKNQILTPKQLYDFCVDNIKGVTYLYVPTDEIESNEKYLRKRFENYKALPQTREKHKIVPLDNSTLRCYQTSRSPEYEDISILSSNITVYNSSNMQANDYIVCVYDGKWYPAQVTEVSTKHDDVHVTFFQPPGPRTSFRKTTEECWVPFSNVLRKLTPLELSRRTGRNSYQISETLCNEISILYKIHFGI